MGRMTYTLAMRAYVARRLAEDFDMSPEEAARWADYFINVYETGAAEPGRLVFATGLVEHYKLEAL